MGAQRRVTYASVQDNIPGSVITGVETWGQLKNEFPAIAAKASGMKVYIKESSADVTSDSTFLPTGDFTIYFLLEKNKSGNE